jgi:hypothetical protein
MVRQWIECTTGPVMKYPLLLQVSLAICAAALAAVGRATPEITRRNEWPLHDNGLNQIIQWDHYSMKINGERLFIWSGEVCC